jgi:RNA polymerase sigma-70 factor, ECF subfamily
MVRVKVFVSARPSRAVQDSVSQSVRPATGDPDIVSVAKTPSIADLRGDFRALYDAWFEDVSRWIVALGGLEADRDDIVQEVFLVVRRRLSAFDGTNLAGWLYRITRRQVRDFRRRSWVRHIFTKRRLEEPDDLPHGGSTPAAALERKEDRRLLHSMLAKMGEERRLAFVLFEIEGLSGEEIARIQSVPVNTVWTRLYHARREFFALAAKFQKRTQSDEATGRVSTGDWSRSIPRVKGKTK